MAVIRPTPPRRFRHFGGPEQAGGRAVRLGMGRLVRFLGVMLRRWVLTVIVGWAVTLVIAAVSSPFVLVGWNSGITAAFHAPPLTWLQAYGLALFVAAFSGMFKSSLVVNSREE